MGFILAAVQRKWLREDSGVAMWNDGGMVARGREYIIRKGEYQVLYRNLTTSTAVTTRFSQEQTLPL